MQKILVICGPTATGKTSLAINLAKKFNGEIISADSRQVYKCMNIGTGKDIPPDVRCQTSAIRKVGFYKIKNIPLWGYDLADFKKEFSVSLYLKIARRIVQDIQKRNKLPIIVGGTGLYIQGLIDGIASLDIPRNNLLRVRLEKKSVDEILKVLLKVDPERASLLNVSDKKNKRRLIRALEIIKFNKSHKKIKSIPGLAKKNKIFFVGLTGDTASLNKRIKRRVSKRIKDGFEKEIKSLIKKGFLKSPQALNTMGYKQWLLNKSNKGTFNEFINTWETAERKYAKRQITWFKKEKRINWHNVNELGFDKTIEIEFKKWYDEGNETSRSKGRTLI